MGLLCLVGVFGLIGCSHSLPALHSGHPDNNNNNNNNKIRNNTSLHMVKMHEIKKSTMPNIAWTNQSPVSRLLEAPVEISMHPAQHRNSTMHRLLGTTPLMRTTRKGLYLEFRVNRA